MKTQSRDNLNSTLSKMDKAYASGSKSWFDFLDDEIIIYTNTSAVPFKGKKSYYDNFAKLLGSSKRKLEILSRQIQEIGNVFIVYQVVQVIQDGVMVNMKQSQVWAETKRGLKMNHLHSSVLGTPLAKVNSKKLSSINIINEKIATVAAAVGVAQ